MDIEDFSNEELQEEYNKILREIENRNFNALPNYKEGYNLLVEYWDSIDDDEKIYLHKQLSKMGL